MPGGVARGGGNVELSNGTLGCEENINEDRFESSLLWPLHLYLDFIPLYCGLP